jgi:Family of unknown function (DUF6455)
MNVYTLLTSIALFLLLAYFIQLLFRRIRSNVITGQKYRTLLHQQLDSLRMSKMMSALGINKERYLHQQSVNDIQHQMKRCGDCANTDQCDEALTGGSFATTDIGFCDNEPELAEILKAQSQATTNE